MRGQRTALLAVVGGFATVPLLVGTTFVGFNWLIVPIFALTLLVAEALRRVAAVQVWGVPALFGAALALAVVSTVSGVLNGLSDEPYSTPAYAHLGWALYERPVVFTYVQYGIPHLESSFDVYLPLLTFVQVPGLDYRWVSLVAWSGAVYLVRRDAFTAAALANPWIALLAANGQNDFVPLLALTVALAVRPARSRWVAEILSLGLKQLANVVVFFYHLARREFVSAAVALGVTVAILAPFLWIDPGAVYCHVLLGDPGSTCQSRGIGFIAFKRNYWLYPTWVAAVFHRPLAAWLRRRLRRHSATPVRVGGDAHPENPTPSPRSG